MTSLTTPGPGWRPGGKGTDGFNDDLLDDWAGGSPFPPSDHPANW
ncbi:MAG TPA: hypothetical protein VN748_19685 [Pseudonocardiaceae bacterium]|jgi:hypothetical protein|nr:hypothetical protein [Pseudonocardiaceae bacterium]